MRKIPLTRNRFALIDDDQWDSISKYNWYCTANGYAARDYVVLGKKRVIMMHRQVTGADPKMVVDHKDGDKLDNRRENLRVCTQSMNGANRIRLNKNNRSGLRGVSWHKSAGKWRARIMVEYKDVHLGLFESKDDAIAARNAAAFKYFGEYIS